MAPIIEYTPARRNLRGSTMAATHDRDEIVHKDLKLGSKIAEGSFGCVFKATLWGQEVAVKTLTGELKDKQN
jgi:hypothetical protein